MKISLVHTNGKKECSLTMITKFMRIGTLVATRSRCNIIFHPHDYQIHWSSFTAAVKKAGKSLKDMSFLKCGILRICRKQDVEWFDP
jgi:hypothetical protein